MFKPNKPLLCLSLCLIFLLAYPRVFAQETITFSTYYPSPYGSYNQLQTNSFGVGDVNNDGNLDASDVPTNPGEVWIKGKVGIGTGATGPRTPLHILGQNSLPTSTSLNEATMLVGNTTNNAILGFGTQYSGSGSSYAWIQGGFKDAPNYSPLLLQPNGGNVGIGTTGPGSKLSISGAAGTVTGISLGNVGESISTSRYIGITESADNTVLSANSGFSGIEFGGPSSANEGYLAFHTHDLGVASAERMRIDKSGNVGIGTTGPGSRLTVVSATNGTEAYFTVLPQNLSQSVNIGYNHIFEGGTNGNNTLNIDSQSTGNLVLQANGGTGNVGIGTTGPGSLLTLGGGQIQIGDGTINADSSIYLRGSASGNKARIVLNHFGVASYVIGVGDISGKLSLTHTQGGSDGIIIDSTGLVGIGTTNPNCLLTVNGSLGSLMGCTVSDLRYKKNIQQLSDDTLNRVLKLRGVNFDWRREEFKKIHFPEGRQIGIIAQELEKEFPELVTTDKEGYKAVSYDRLTAVLLEAIKAQQKEIELLRQDLANVKR